MKMVNWKQINIIFDGKQYLVGVNDKHGIFAGFITHIPSKKKVEEIKKNKALRQKMFNDTQQIPHENKQKRLLRSKVRYYERTVDKLVDKQRVEAREKLAKSLRKSKYVVIKKICKDCSKSGLNSTHDFM